MPFVVGAHVWERLYGCAQVCVRGPRIWRSAFPLSLLRAVAFPFASSLPLSETADPSRSSRNENMIFAHNRAELSCVHTKRDSPTHKRR